MLPRWAFFLKPCVLNYFFNECFLTFLNSLPFDKLLGLYLFRHTASLHLCVCRFGVWMTIFQEYPSRHQERLPASENTDKSPQSRALELLSNFPWRVSASQTPRKRTTKNPMNCGVFGSPFFPNPSKGDGQEDCGDLPKGQQFWMIFGPILFEKLFFEGLCEWILAFGGSCRG